MLFILPHESFQELMLYLNVGNILNIAEAFNIPKHIVDSDYLWKKKMQIDRLQPLEPSQRSVNYENFQRTFECAEQGLYMYLYNLRKIWLNKNMRDALRPFRRGLNPAHVEYVDSRIIITRKGEHKLEVRNIAKVKDIYTFQTSDVLCSTVNVQFPFIITLCKGDEHYIISVYNIELKKSLWRQVFAKTLNAEKIFCTRDNMIAAWTSDVTKIRLINISTGVHKTTLPHDTEICEAFYCKNYLLTKTNSNKCLNIWDTDSEILKYSIDISTKPIAQFLYNGQAYVILCTHKNEFSYVLNLEDGKMHELKTQLTDNKSNIVMWRSEVIFCDMDHNLKIVDYITSQCLVDKKCEFIIQGVTANSNFVILSTSEGGIRILDHDTCDALRIIKVNYSGKRSFDIVNWKALESKLVYTYADSDKSIVYLLDFDVYSYGTENLSERTFGGGVPKRISFQMFVLFTLVFIIIYVYLINNMFYKYKN